MSATRQAAPAGALVCRPPCLARCNPATATRQVAGQHGRSWGAQVSAILPVHSSVPPPYPEPPTHQPHAPTCAGTCTAWGAPPAWARAATPCSSCCPASAGTWSTWRRTAWRCASSPRCRCSTTCWGPTERWGRGGGKAGGGVLRRQRGAWGPSPAPRVAAVACASRLVLDVRPTVSGYGSAACTRTRAVPGFVLRRAQPAARR